MDIEFILPPDDHIDDNGNYIGNDPEILKQERCMDKYKSDTSKRVEELFKKATIVDTAALHEAYLEMEKKEDEKTKHLQIVEQKRIDQMECPVCHSNDKTRNKLIKDNGVLGPGYDSHVILAYYVCNGCGVHYSDLKKK